MSKNEFSKTASCTLAIMFLAFMTLSDRLRAEIVQFTSTIDGKQARECQGTGSPATGTATFTLDTETGFVSYEIQFAENLLLGAELFAHVHGPAARCEPASIIYGLPLGNPKTGTAIVDEDEAQDMLKGLHYLNIHTEEVGSGEIRGQIVRIVRTPVLSLWSLLALGLGLLGSGFLVNRRR